MQLTERQKAALGKHAAHHTAKHVAAMRAAMRRGQSFAAAYARVQREVGQQMGEWLVPTIMGIQAVSLALINRLRFRCDPDETNRCAPWRDFHRVRNRASSSRA